MKTKLTPDQISKSAIAVKVANADEITEFFDRVQDRLDLYDALQKPVVEERPKRH